MTTAGETDSHTFTDTPPPSGSFPATGVLDDFNRADGAPGSSWDSNTTGYQVQSNALDVTTGGTVYWNTSFGADQEAHVTLTTIDTSAEEIDLLLKGQPGAYTCDMLEVLYKPSSGTVEVWTCAAEAWSQHGAAMC
jgi:hypothetical protein